jgi:hypothetical protein
MIIDKGPGMGGCGRGPSTGVSVPGMTSGPSAGVGLMAAAEMRGTESSAPPASIVPAMPIAAASLQIAAR